MIRDLHPGASTVHTRARKRIVLELCAGVRSGICILVKSMFLLPPCVGKRNMVDLRRLNYKLFMNFCAIMGRRTGAWDGDTKVSLVPYLSPKEKSRPVSESTSDGNDYVRDRTPFFTPFVHWRMRNSVLKYVVFIGVLGEMWGFID